MNSNENLALIEKYWEGQLEETQKLEFEQRLAKEMGLAQAFQEYQILRENLQKYGQRQNLKLKLDSFHQEMLDNEPINQSKLIPIPQTGFWQRYKGMLAVAASVAIFTVMSTVLIINYLSDIKQQQAGAYQALQRELSLVKKEQARQSQNQIESKVNQYGATAFVIASNGYLVTNYHVIKQADSIYIEATRKGKRLRLAVEIAHSNKQFDLAILKVKTTDFQGFAQLPFVLKNLEADLGEAVFTLAYPRNDLVYGEGSISAKSGYVGDTTAYQISIPVNPGNSGSPLFDNTGQLIGVVTGKQTDLEGATFAVKAKYLQQVLDSLQKKSPQTPLWRNQWHQIQYLNRPTQIKSLQDFVYEVKVYKGKR
jgi:S1-C subfamily serine protease